MPVGIAGRAIAFMIGDMNIGMAIQGAHKFVRRYLAEQISEAALRLLRQDLAAKKSEHDIARGHR